MPAAAYGAMPAPSLADHEHLEPRLKLPYSHGGNPHRITQSLIAMLTGLQVPLLCSETHELEEEIVASYLYQVHSYHWLETNDFGRFLSNNDI